MNVSVKSFRFILMIFVAVLVIAGCANPVADDQRPNPAPAPNSPAAPTDITNASGFQYSKPNADTASLTIVPYTQGLNIVGQAGKSGSSVVKAVASPLTTIGTTVEYTVVALGIGDYIDILFAQDLTWSNSKGMFVRVEQGASDFIYKVIPYDATGSFTVGIPVVGAPVPGSTAGKTFIVTTKRNAGADGFVIDFNYAGGTLQTLSIADSAIVGSPSIAESAYLNISPGSISATAPNLTVTGVGVNTAIVTNPSQGTSSLPNSVSISGGNSTIGAGSVFSAFTAVASNFTAAPSFAWTLKDPTGATVETASTSTFTPAVISFAGTYPLDLVATKDSETASTTTNITVTAALEVGKGIILKDPVGLKGLWTSAPVSLNNAMTILTIDPATGWTKTGDGSGSVLGVVFGTQASTATGKYVVIGLKHYTNSGNPYVSVDTAYVFDTSVSANFGVLNVGLDNSGNDVHLNPDGSFFNLQLDSAGTTYKFGIKQDPSNNRWLFQLNNAVYVLNYSHMPADFFGDASNPQGYAYVGTVSGFGSWSYTGNLKYTVSNTSMAETFDFTHVSTSSVTWPFPGNTAGFTNTRTSEFGAFGWTFGNTTFPTSSATPYVNYDLLTSGNRNLQLNAANGYVVMPVMAATSGKTLTFKTAVNAGTAAVSVDVQTSPDGTSWTTQTSLVHTNGGTEISVFSSAFDAKTVPLPNATTHVRFLCLSRTAGHIKIDDVSIQ